MSTGFNYSSKQIVLGSDVIDRVIAVPHQVLHFNVPSGAVASFKLGSRDADAIPLQAGWQRFCLSKPGDVIYLTATKGDPIEVFTSQDIVGDFFGGGGNFFSVVEWALEIHWPPPVGNMVHLGAMQTVGAPRKGLHGDSKNFIGGASGLGGDFMILYDDIAGMGMDSTLGPRRRGLADAAAILMPLTVRPGIVLPSHRRVFWDRFTIALSRAAPVPNMIYETGIQYSLSSGGLPGWITGGNNAWGIFQDGAGGWVWVENTGALPVEFSVALPWPRSINEWVTVDIVHFAATPNRDAKVFLYLDEVLVLSRSWGDGILPVYADLAGSITIVRSIQANSNSSAIVLGPSHAKQGAFDSKLNLITT